MQTPKSFVSYRELCEEVEFLFYEEKLQEDQIARRLGLTMTAIQSILSGEDDFDYDYDQVPFEDDSDYYSGDSFAGERDDY
jgi:hypothetical protein